MPPRVTSDTYFAIIPEWLLDTASPRAIQIYGFLMRYADKDDRTAFPTRSTLAKRAQCSVKTIDRTLVELSGFGAVTITPRFDSAGDRTSNLYRLHQTTRGGDTSDATPRDTGDATGGDTSDAENQSHLEPEPLEPDATSNGLSTVIPHDQMVWAIIDALGWDRNGIPETQWGRIHKAAKQLVDINANPSQVEHRVKVYRVNYDGAAVTPNAIASNWADLAEVREPVSRRDVKVASTRARSRMAIAALEDDS